MKKHSEWLDDPRVNMISPDAVSEGRQVQVLEAGQWEILDISGTEKAWFMKRHDIDDVDYYPISAVFIDPSGNLYLSDWILEDKGF